MAAMAKLGIAIADSVGFNSARALIYRNEINSMENTMKMIASGLLVLCLLAAQVSEANAAACAAGPYRAGCVGPRGAVGVHRGYGYHGGYGYGRRCFRGAYGRVVCR
jgi:hypothetical protein